MIKLIRISSSFFFGNSNFSPGISFLDGAFPSAFWRNGKRFEWHETGARRRRSFPRRFGPSPRACAIIRPGHFCPAFVTYSGRSRGASSKFIPSNIRASNLARPDEFYISNIEKKKKKIYNHDSVSTCPIKIPPDRLGRSSVSWLIRYWSTRTCFDSIYFRFKVEYDCDLYRKPEPLRRGVS